MTEKESQYRKQKEDGGYQGTGGLLRTDRNDKIVLDKLLKDNDLIHIPIDGDGNCLYRAISDQLYSTTDHHLYVRNRVAEHVKKHPIYTMFLDNTVDGDIDAFVRRISKNGVHGGHIELMACARSYGINIEIYQLNDQKLYIEGNWKGDYDECGECLATIEDKELPTIKLLYHRRHYASVRDRIPNKSGPFPLQLPR